MVRERLGTPALASDTILNETQSMAAKDCFVFVLHYTTY